MISFRRAKKPLFARVARVNGEVRTFEEIPFYADMPDGTKRKIETPTDLTIYYMMVRGTTEEKAVTMIPILDTVANKEKFVHWCASHKEATVDEILSKCIEIRKESDAKGKSGASRNKMGSIKLIVKDFDTPIEMPFEGHLFQLVAVNGVPVKHHSVRKNRDGSFTDIGEKSSTEVARGGSRLVWGKQ